MLLTSLNTITLITVIHPIELLALAEASITMLYKDYTYDVTCMN